MLRTIRSLLKKPVFEKGNADWLSELSSVTKQNNNTIHHSIKITPNQASKKSNKKEVYSNLQDRRVKQQPKFKIGQLVRTAEIKKVFSKGDSTIIEIVHDNIPSYRDIYFYPRDITKIYYYKQN